MSIKRSHLKKFFITSKFKESCINNRYSLTMAITEAINKLHSINPVILFMRPVRFSGNVTIRIDHETYKKYNELKSFLTMEGLCILINDVVANNAEYTMAINKSAEIRGVIAGEFSDIDSLIIEDVTLTDKEKRFLIELDPDMKELLYYDREMLAKTDIE